MYLYDVIQETSGHEWWPIEFQAFLAVGNQISGGFEPSGWAGIARKTAELGFLFLC